MIESFEQHLEHIASEHEGYVSAYQALPVSADTELREQIAEDGLSVYRNYFLELNLALDNGVAMLEVLDDEMKDADSSTVLAIEDEVDDLAMQILGLRKTAYKFIGLSVRSSIGPNEDIADDVKEARFLAGVRSQEKIAQAKEQNKELHGTLAEKIEDILGPLGHYEEAVLKALAIYANTDVEIKRSLILAESGLPQIEWANNIDAINYGNSRRLIIDLLERHCGDLIRVDKVKKSPDHTSGGVKTYTPEQIEETDEAVSTIMPSNPYRSSFGRKQAVLGAQALKTDE